MLEFTLITGRTVAQGEAMEKGKNLENFSRACASVELDPNDMVKIGVSEGDTVKIETPAGSVAVKAVKSKDVPHEGIAFMPLGPWANTLVGSGTDGTGMPPFKGIKATVVPAPDDKVLGTEELVETLYSKFLEDKG